MKNKCIYFLVFILIFIFPFGSKGQDLLCKCPSVSEFDDQRVYPYHIFTNFKCTRINNTIFFDSSMITNYIHVINSMDILQEIGCLSGEKVLFLNLSKRKDLRFKVIINPKNSSLNIIIKDNNYLYKIRTSNLNLLKLNNFPDTLAQSVMNINNKLLDLNQYFLRYAINSGSFVKQKNLVKSSGMLLIPLSILTTEVLEALVLHDPYHGIDSLARTPILKKETRRNYFLCIKYKSIDIRKDDKKITIVSQPKTLSNLLNRNRVEYFNYVNKDKLTKTKYDTLSDQEFESASHSLQNLVKISSPNNESLVSVLCNYRGYTSDYLNTNRRKRKALFFLFNDRDLGSVGNYQIGYPVISDDNVRGHLFSNMGDSVYHGRYFNYVVNYEPGTIRGNQYYINYFKRKRKKP